MPTKDIFLNWKRGIGPLFAENNTYFADQSGNESRLDQKEDGAANRSCQREQHMRTCYKEVVTKYIEINTFIGYRFYQLQAVASDKPTQMSGWNQYPRITAHQSTGSWMALPTCARLHLSGLRWLIRPCPGGWALSRMLSWSAVALLAAMRLTTQQVRLASGHMAGGGGLESQGEHIPMWSTSQVSLESHLLLSWWPRQVTCQAHGQHRGGGDPRTWIIKAMRELTQSLQQPTRPAFRCLQPLRTILD